MEGILPCSDQLRAGQISAEIIANMRPGANRMRPDRGANPHGQATERDVAPARASRCTEALPHRRAKTRHRIPLEFFWRFYQEEGSRAANCSELSRRMFRLLLASISF